MDNQDIRMSKEEILTLINETFHTTKGNEVFIDEAGKSVTMFDEPLTGFSQASDPIYETFKKPEIIGPRYMTPKEWLSDAETVISVCFPYTEEVRASTRGCKRDPSIEWLYGRIEGHAFLQKFMRELVKCLEQKGIRCCIPADDERYTRYPREYKIDGTLHRHMEIVWSERHAGYASGLGTFGLSRCLITRKGSAMRLINCIVNLKLEPTLRDYEQFMEYCSLCGACIKRCPVGAISFAHSKNNVLCANWNGELKERHYPRYGCANCMTAVPCENGIPVVPSR